MRNNTQNSQEKHNEAGFAFIVIPILVALFGFFVTAMVKDTRPNQFYFEVSTQEKMKDVKKAMAAYVHRNYRVPCPAVPDAGAANFGDEANPPTVAGDECATTVGILPFRELGLPEDAAKDEWGNFLTYKVSPNFTRLVNDSGFTFVGADDDGDSNPDFPVSSGGPENFVHQICRTNSWINNNATYLDSSGNPQAHGVGRFNENIYKANFCCPSNVTGTVGGSSSVTREFRDDKPEADLIQTTTSMRIGENDEIILGVEAIDPDIALLDDAVDAYHVTKSNERINAALNNGDVFAYTETLYHAGTPVGNALGFSAPWQGAGNEGKYWKTAATIEIDQAVTGGPVESFDITLSDIDTHNTSLPMQISVQILDTDGNPIPTSSTDSTPLEISYVMALPDTASGGQAAIQITAQDIYGDPQTDPRLFYDDHPSKAWRLNHTGALPAQEARDLFAASKAKMMQAMADAGLSASDARLGRVKFNATHASIGMSEISYNVSQAATFSATPTDLIINDEQGDPRLALRDQDSSYDEANVIHSAAIAQDFEAAAYVLISHGPDGEGSFVKGTTAQLDNIPDADENPFEVINHDETTNEVRDVRKIVSTNQGENFDDIIMWDSQVTLYNAFSNGTCESAQSL